MFSGVTRTARWFALTARTAGLLLLVSICAQPAQAFGVQLRGFVQQGSRLAVGADVSLRFELGSEAAPRLPSAASGPSGGVGADEVVDLFESLEGFGAPLAPGAGASERGGNSAPAPSASTEVSNPAGPAASSTGGRGGPATRGARRSAQPVDTAQRVDAASPTGASRGPGAGSGSSQRASAADPERSQGTAPVPAGPQSSSAQQPSAAPRAAAPSSSEAEARRPASSSVGRVAAEPYLTRRFVRRLLHEATRAQRRARGRTRQLSHQANVSAWLPRLQLRVGRYRDETLRLTPTVAEPDRWQLTGGADWRIDGQATWQLNRLVFTSEQLALERLRAQAQRELERRELQVLQLLFEWHRAAVALSSEAFHADEKQAAWWTAQEARLQLDVLSGGWFSRHAPQLEPAPWPLDQ